jgi:hypothetical protein
MEHAGLTTYLNDHLAGSVAAIDLLDHLLERAPSPEAKRLFADLRAEVSQDQEALQVIIRRAGADESGWRKAGAWISEKLGRLKLRIDDPANDTLHELEAVEALTLGLLGKLALWRALATAGADLEWLHGIDLDRLQQRGLDQHARAEARRLELAHTLLAPISAGGARRSNHRPRPRTLS